MDSKTTIVSLTNGEETYTTYILDNIYYSNNHTSALWTLDNLFKKGCVISLVKYEDKYITVGDYVCWNHGKSVGKIKFFDYTFDKKEIKAIMDGGGGSVKIKKLRRLDDKVFLSYVYNQMAYELEQNNEQ